MHVQGNYEQNIAMWHYIVFILKIVNFYPKGLIIRLITQLARNSHESSKKSTAMHFTF